MKLDFFNKNKKEELPSEVKKIFSPSREFNEQAKGRFLAAFDARYSAAPTSRFAFALKLSVGVLAVIMVLIGGASVYADTANVPADNILYPLKRLNEAVQLAVAPTQVKAQLQATFAARRVTEIADLETRKPSSTIIAKLETAADVDVNASIADSESAGLQDGSLTDLCAKLFSTIATSSPALQVKLSANAGVLLRFARRCDRANAVITQPTTSITTSTATGTITLSGVTSTSSSTINLEARVRRILDLHLPVVPTTTTATSSVNVSTSIKIPKIPIKIGL